MSQVRKRTWQSGGQTKTAWVADYHDSSRRRHIKTFKTRKAADEWLNKTMLDVRQGLHTPERQSISVKEACDLWLQRGQLIGLEKSTLKNYSNHTVKIIQYLGNEKLSRLTKPGVHAFRDKLLTEGLTHRTSRHVLTSLKGVLTHAEERGLVAQNVALRVTVVTPSRLKRKLEVGVDVPTKNEVQRLIAVDSRWRPLIVTAVMTGMRASELRGLRWVNVDFAKKVIHVKERADFLGALGMPKSEAGQRAIPLSPMVVNVLREWKLACPKGELGLVFPNSLGNIESHSNLVNRIWRPTQVAAGVIDDEGNPRYRFHSLRRFAASWFIEQGFSPKRLQMLLGHNSIKMVMDVYGALFPNDEDDQQRFEMGERSILTAT